MIDAILEAGIASIVGPGQALQDNGTTVWQNDPVPD